MVWTITFSTALKFVARISDNLNQKDGLSDSFTWALKQIMSTAVSKKLSEQIEKYKQEAEIAKKELNFEFTFLLLDKVALLESKLNI